MDYGLYALWFGFRVWLLTLAVGAVVLGAVVVAERGMPHVYVTSTHGVAVALGKGHSAMVWRIERSGIKFIDCRKVDC